LTEFSHSETNSEYPRFLDSQNFKEATLMKVHSDISQDPFADGIANPIRHSASAADDTPVAGGTESAFPPDQEPEAESTIGSTAGTVASGGLIGSASSTCDNLADAAPNPGE
jgi:hypothetical protein